jgi:hypothetical protein
MKMFLAEPLEEHDRNLYKMPKSYQRMVRMAREDAEAEPLELIHKGGFKSCLPEEAEMIHRDIKKQRQ